ncbi:DNA alkylation repair protein [Pseudonocardia spinosispora]|uniref:DNA alkylation repair protein n=1 Tax=Pseudonocardia spinosispora TaxID=103441 RepID=UPI000685AAAC|nr:DNA alkylation repair protein [Pseudonocardia spinosispora]
MTGHSGATRSEADALVAAVRDGLLQLADPAAAPGMQQYMRSEMPFLGVPKPLRTQLERRLVPDHPLAAITTFELAVRTLWDEATYREERYLALSITGNRRYRAHLVPQLVPLYRDWIVDGAWWDYVDEIAARRIGPLLDRRPGDLEPMIRAWSADPDRWLRRTAIICQLGAGKATDLVLLSDCIEAAIDEPDFFLRKGIGWALRQYARVDPEWVRAFVRAHPGLSPLSRREALKHIGAG